MQIQVASMQAKGETITAEKEQELLQAVKQKYDEQTSPYYAASRLWIDEIIDPLHTRRVIASGIEAANHNPEIPAFKTGVIQT
jgi:acetyl-CoA carboxylase carboxyltransferase component